jgi:hypothetical protein
MKASELIQRLKKASVEIANDGHNGWGNLCTEAADTLLVLLPVLEAANEVDLLWNELNMELCPDRQYQKLRDALAAARERIEP